MQNVPAACGELSSVLPSAHHASRAAVAPACSSEGQSEWISCQNQGVWGPVIRMWGCVYLLFIRAVCFPENTRLAAMLLSQGG